ncbi:MAG TPA: hypothetical protein PKJ57_08890, partial [Bacillota bacterium]|nr:hypothetical protein [Bacillota bacterium]
SGGRFSTTFLENVAVFRPLFQKMWASFDHQTVICQIMGVVVVDILPPQRLIMVENLPPLSLLVGETLPF